MIIRLPSPGTGEMISKKCHHCVCILFSVCYSMGSIRCYKIVSISDIRVSCLYYED